MAGAGRAKGQLKIKFDLVVNFCILPNIRILFKILFSTYTRNNETCTWEWNSLDDWRPDEWRSIFELSTVKRNHASGGIDIKNLGRD